ncbi:MAG TPA: FKBP-type peptidyl-prolyl cis-trans isomerase [Usitatibacter sp.]|nr:FKBP-type peptidyl-prolyl cis-trans isomerase [Usitatibacter sp.]
MNKALAWAALALAAGGCAGTDTKTTASQPAPAASAATAASTNCVPPPADLVVKDLEPGKGDTARFRTAVLVDYTGWLYDGCKPDFKGAEFDSSSGRQPLSFMVGVGRVIRGWDEGLLGMKEGGKRLLIIPADKAYGAGGAPGGKIPPNSALVFEVTLQHIIMQAGPPK